nr:hypothetical protein CDS [Bradyrhizobium sp.]
MMMSDPRNITDTTIAPRQPPLWLNADLHYTLSLIRQTACLRRTARTAKVSWRAKF